MPILSVGLILDAATAAAVGGGATLASACLDVRHVHVRLTPGMEAQTKINYNYNLETTRAKNKPPQLALM